MSVTQVAIAATAITKLAGAAGVNGPMLQLINNNADANDTALDLRVQAGEPPMRVNSSTGVANLNADMVDGSDAPLWATVSFRGTLLRAKGATSSTRAATGFYIIVFNKDVSKCAYTATLGGGNATFEPDGIVQATNRTSDAKAVSVSTNNLSGAVADRGFHLVVNC